MKEKTKKILKPIFIVLIFVIIGGFLGVQNYKTNGSVQRAVLDATMFVVIQLICHYFFVYRGIRKAKKDPAAAKMQEISAKDERNIKIREKSGYTTLMVAYGLLIAMYLIFIFLDYMVPSHIVAGAGFLLLIANFVIHAINSKKM